MTIKDFSKAMGDLTAGVVKDDMKRQKELSPAEAMHMNVVVEQSHGFKKEEGDFSRSIPRFDVEVDTEPTKDAVYARPPTPHDPVNMPAHYRAGDTYETIRVIEAWNLGFNLGNAVKYISRWQRKGGVEDLKKARWYLDREIASRESANGKP